MNKVKHNYPKNRKAAPPFSEERKRKIGLAHTGNNHYAWLGNKVGYRDIHLWVTRWKGKPDTCEGCGKTGLKGKQIVWANIDHKYNRILDNFIRLCSKCHGKYDVEHNLRKHKK